MSSMLGGMTPIGPRVTQARQRDGLSKADVARIAGIARTRLYRIEGEECPLDIGLMRVLATVGLLEAVAREITEAVAAERATALAQQSAVAARWRHQEAIGVPEQQEEDLLTSGQLATELGVSAGAVKRRLESGRYPGAYRTPGGHWRIPRSAVDVADQ